MEIPKTMIVERIRSRGGPEMADRADRELPEKLGPDELRDEFRGQSPVAG